MRSRFGVLKTGVLASVLLTAPCNASETQVYQYDELGRLVAVVSSGTINNGQTHSICYDPASNRTRYKSDSAGAGVNCGGTGATGLSIGNATVTEGGALTFIVTRTGNVSVASSVNYATASGTAASGSDFTASSGTVNFAANQTAATIMVSTIDDTVAEPAETMTVTLSNPSAGFTITTATGTGTINDNDTAYLAISDASALEGYMLGFKVTRSGNTAGSTSFNYATASGSAGTGDYYTVSGPMTFAPGETSKTISVLAKTDTRIEADEVFYLNLSGATGGAVITRSQGLGTIYDDGNGGCPTC